MPHWRSPPQPSAICPQFAPACSHVRGTHAGAPHLPFTHGVFAGHAQFRIAPQPSATGPHDEPGAGAGHCAGWQAPIPQTFGVPPPPQVVPPWQGGQTTVPPQPSAIVPHWFASHCFFTQAGAPHLLATPPPPHVCPSGHIGHWMTLPQPSPA